MDNLKSKHEMVWLDNAVFGHDKVICSILTNKMESLFIGVVGNRKLVIE